MRIGVIADTHNYLDPAVPKLFSDVEHILHAGDIGQPKILLALEQLAPVTAVSGNTDDPTFRFPMIENVELAGRRFLVHHIVNPHSPSETLTRAITRHRPDIIIFGHTHKAFCQTIAGILFFNPGYAGKQRFALERTVAILDCDDQGIRPKYLEL